LLAALEKRCRVGNDNSNLVRACEASLQYCKDAGDDELLLTTLQTLSTRRSQKTAAIRALVQKSIPWVMEGQYKPLAVPDGEKKARDKLVEALREISDGKIFLEAERARLTRCMAMIMVSFLLLLLLVVVVVVMIHAFCGSGGVAMNTACTTMKGRIKHFCH
jgi:26S proteasome regulatory subunit N5